MYDVKFGIFLPTHDFGKAKAAAESAEQQGFYSVSINDHFFPPMGPEQRKVPQLECYTTLSAIAALTKRVKLAPTVTAMSFRNPALLAKMTSTLDQISGGRFIAGLGSGWLRDEYDANGYPYPSNAERLDQLAEAIRRAQGDVDAGASRAIAAATSRSTRPIISPIRCKSRIRP